MNKGNRMSAAKNLGYSLHFIQDVCEPHHSNSLSTIGHAYFENWVANNLDSIDITNYVNNISNDSFTRMDSNPDNLLIAASWSGHHYRTESESCTPNIIRPVATETFANACKYTIFALYYFASHT